LKDVWKLNQVNNKFLQTRENDQTLK
jgi:hypothetical protein